MRSCFSGSVAHFPWFEPLSMSSPVRCCEAWPNRRNLQLYRRFDAYIFFSVGLTRTHVWLVRNCKLIRSWDARRETERWRWVDFQNKWKKIAIRGHAWKNVRRWIFNELQPRLELGNQFNLENRSLVDFLCLLVHAKLFFPRAPKGCSQTCLMVLYPPEIVFTSSHSRRMKSCRLTIILGRYNFTKKYLWKNRPEDFRHPDAVFKNDLLGLVRKSFFKFRLVSKIFLG